jgi:uncharacterized protein YjbJ (UPF0337 family)
MRRRLRDALAAVCTRAHRRPASKCRQSSAEEPSFNLRKDTEMNWDRIEGNWKQFKGNVKEQWGKLTDDELDVIAGKRDNLVGKIQETYGISKDETEKQLADWQKRIQELGK